MARTLIGRLILRLQTDGLGEAKKLTDTMRDVQNAARRLGSGPTPTWGAAFQRSLERMKAAPGEIDAVRRSWVELHDSMRSRNIGSALRSSEVSHWKAGTLRHFAEVRNDARRTQDQIDRMYAVARRGGAGIGTGAAATLGIGGGIYGAAYLGREAATAASEEQRVQAEAKFAGLSDEERGRIDVRAEELANRYRLPKARAYDVLKDATLNMATIDDALASSEVMAQALLALSNIHGAEEAVAGLRRFNRAMDNIEKIEPTEYRNMLDGYMRAQQVVGPDIDPSAFEQAIKYSRTAGKIGGEEFLSQWLPLLIAQIGGPNAGTQTRAFFDQFVVGRAPKSALNKQREYGLRDGEDRLIGQAEFGENPIKWVYDYMLPQLDRAGVDMDDKVELARVIGTLTNNRNSSDFIQAAILNMEQWFRLIEQRMPQAAGLSAAHEVQDLNPFASWQGVKDALRNLSGAVGEDVLPGLVQRLNQLADGINSFQQSIRDGDALPKVALAGGAAAGVTGAALFARSVYRLVTAGDRLHSSAAALTRAAAALGASGAADGVPDATGAGRRGGSSWMGFLATLGRWGTVAGAAAVPSLLSDTPGDTFDDQVARQRSDRESLERVIGRGGEVWRNMTRNPAAEIGGMIMSPEEAGEVMSRDRLPNAPDTARFGDPITPQIDTASATAEVQAANAALSAALQVKGTASLDTATAESAIDRLAAKVRGVLALIGQASTMAERASVNVDAELRRDFSDGNAWR